MRLRRGGGIEEEEDAILIHAPLAEAIETFWATGNNRQTVTWREQREINMVMLVSSLAPGGYVRIWD